MVGPDGSFLAREILAGCYKQRSFGVVWHSGMGVTTQPQNPGFGPQCAGGFPGPASGWPGGPLHPTQKSRLGVCPTRSTPGPGGASGTARAVMGQPRICHERDVWHSGMGVTTQPQNPGFEPQFRHKCWANPAVPAAISKVAAVVCCCSNGWS